MSYLTQMAGLAVQNFVSAAVGHRRPRRRRPRLRAPLDAATLGNFWVDLYRSIVYILAPLAVVVDRLPDLAGRAADVPRPRDRDDARRGRTQTIARGPVALAGSRSSSSGRTAAASTTRTRPSRSRTRPGSDELHRDDRDPADPGGARCSCSGRWCFARRHALGGVRGDVRRCSRSASRSILPAEQHGSRGAAQLGREPHAGQRPERRQHDRQGGPLRASPTARSGPTPTTGRLERLGQRRPRRAARRSAELCRS